MRGPVVLLILDGYGLAPPGTDNAITTADTPVFDELFAACSTTLQASGEAVGLRPGLMGSSEVNHLNLGAGRVVPQDIVRIDKALADGSLEKHPALTEAFARLKETGTRLHLLGMVSDGGVHSHIDHLEGLIRIAQSAGIEDVYVHAILDGRDTAAKAAERFLERVDAYENVSIATLMGRFYAMDRDQRWEREERAYDAMMDVDSPEHDDWREALRAGYEQGASDEFFPPTNIADRRVRDGDTVLFFNFRTDRTRELTRAFIEKHFDEFDRGTAPNIHFIQMTEYDERFEIPTLFEPLTLDNVLAEWLSHHGASQLHIAETEKYAHVTYFFNGGREEPFDGEERVIIDSPKVETYDETPRMSVDAITDAVCDSLASDAKDVYVVNYANADMVGHTGDFDATIAAVEAIDESIARLREAVSERGGVLVVTADHGNAEAMGGEKTKTHTTNEVPLVIADDEPHTLSPGGVSDVAPTLLELAGLPVPEEMTGRSLLG